MENKMGQSKLGSGGRFKALVKKISAKGNVDNPAAVAAMVGRRKYGNKKFQALATAGKRHGISNLKRG